MYLNLLHFYFSFSRECLFVVVCIHLKTFLVNLCKALANDCIYLFFVKDDCIPLFVSKY